MGTYLSGAARQEGIPKELALFFKGKMGIQNFIETGTYMGETTEWASQHFERVETVEAYEKIYTETSTKLVHLKNIRFHLGDSSKLLPSIIEGLRGPSLFFLDAHGFYGWGQDAVHIIKTITYNMFPLLKELHIIIKNFCENKVIIIDDIRLMTLLRYQYDRILPYPSLSEIIHTLDDTLEFFLFHDCMVILPKEIFYDHDLGTFLSNDALPMYDPQNNSVDKLEKELSTAEHNNQQLIAQLSALQQDRWYRFGRLSRKQKLRTIVRVLCRNLLARN